MLRIAVAGVPLSTPRPGGTVEGLKRARSLGITAMELEWVQRVPTFPERMKEIRATAERLGMVLTVHAPYYINLNAGEAHKLEASKKRITDALSMAELCGAISVCVHAAFYLGMEPVKVFDKIRRGTADILKQKQKLFPHVNLAYETMGRLSQFGSLEEVLILSKEFGIYPCIDAAHLHARTGGQINSIPEWNEMFDTYQSYLGRDSLEKMHLHYSGIDYGTRGERKHLVFKDSDAKWKEYLSVLKRKKIGGVLVIESPVLEKEAVMIMKEFSQL